FVKLEDRKRALISRMLQYMLSHVVLGIPYDEIVIKRTEEGKPYLANKLENLDFPNFNFNSSHHGDFVVIASEPICLVGLDIMCHGVCEKQPALEFVKNFSSYFTNFEWKNILSAGPLDEDILNQFYRRWCLKEAYIKAVGIGLGYKLERLEFHYPAHQIWSDVAYLRIDGIEQKDWQFSLYEFDNCHWVCVARGHPNQAVSSYRKTLWQIEFDKKSYNRGFELPTRPFRLHEIKHLIPENRKEDYANTRIDS
ncbi:hypothetical protein KI387_026056, partial [Taxus chinensis]